ncbi:MAG: hypothetical protein WCE30_12745, partial [Mycobacterium sp.]
AERSRAAATTWQPLPHCDADLTTKPPSTARTASTTASQAPRARRENVKVKLQNWGGDLSDAYRSTSAA